MSSTLATLRTGAVATEVLLHDGDVEVAAVFERCFYVAARGGYVCVGTEAIGDGPLNILLRSDRDTPNWAGFGISREAKGTITRGALSVGENFVIRPTETSTWLPPPWPIVSAPGLRDGLVSVRNAAAPMCPAEGLSRLVFANSMTSGDMVAQAAAPLLKSFSTFLPAALLAERPDAELVRAATLLVGLGPGLTPSGDDFLGGAFLALSAVSAIPLREALWQAIEPEIGYLTVDISGAHLAAAADGLGGAVVHAAISALIRNEAPQLVNLLPQLRALGHSSGFDTLAGIVLTLEAALAVGRLG